MHSVELSRLAVRAAEIDSDLRAMIAVRRLVTPEARPTVDNLRHNLETSEVAYLVAWVGDEPVACGFVEPLADELAIADVAVVPAHRRCGIGSAVLAEIS